MKMLTSSLGVLVLSGCVLRAAEFLPRTGSYEMTVRVADGGVATRQAFEVVSDGRRSAAVFLPTDDGIAPLCLANADRRSCERTLGALTLGRLYRVERRGIVTTAEEVLLPEWLLPGHEWEILRDGVCVFKKRVREAGPEVVVIDDVRLCGGEGVVRGTEVWKKGVGLSELWTAEGVDVVVEWTGL